MAGPGFDAVVLAGGGGRRMAGADKAALSVGGTTLLDRVLSAVTAARTVIVVGAPRPTARPVTWTREQPAGAGPAAAARAGVALAGAEWTVLLAADLPFVTGSTVDRLLAAAAEHGAVLVDGDGIEQWLAGAWPTQALRAAGLRPGGSMRAALAPLRPRLVPTSGVEVLDCDTPQDLARARELA